MDARVLDESIHPVWHRQRDLILPSGLFLCPNLGGQVSVGHLRP